LDAGYTGREQAVGSRRYTAHICSRREEKQEKINNPDYKAQCWVVEGIVKQNV